MCSSTSRNASTSRLMRSSQTRCFMRLRIGLGIKNTINGNDTVREALLDHASSLEEGKADSPQACT